MTCPQILDFETKLLNKKIPSFNVGDTLRVHTKIIEGEKERIQVFTGIVIAIKGKSLSETFSVYRSAYGCSMERVFMMHSPRITKIEIEKRGKVRRAKLYNLRGKSGKKAKVKERIFRKEDKISSVVKAKTEESKTEVKAEQPKVEEKPKKEVSKKPVSKKPKKKKDDTSEEK